MRSKLGLGALASLFFMTALGVLSCGRATDFVNFLRNSPPPVPVQVQAKVKEMNQNNKLDVLWVIDNSGSMQQHQQRVIQNTQSFMDEFLKQRSLDWKMGLVSTHVGDAPYVGFTPTDLLDRRTPDPVKTFQQAVGKLGWNQGCPELVFEPIGDAFTQYPDFVRPRAVLAILALTDTMEENARAKTDFENLLIKFKGSLRNVRFYGTFAGPSFGCPSWEPQWFYPGSPFEYFVTATNGKVFELCTPDFGQKLADIGKDMAKIATYSTFQLKFRPIPGTVQVFYHGTEIPGGQKNTGARWYYDFDLNAVNFYDLDFAVDDEDEVEIRYQKEAETPKT